MSHIHSEENHRPENDFLPRRTTSSPSTISIDRLDLHEKNMNRHLNEAKQIITFLGSFMSYSEVRKEINDHLNLLQNGEI